MTTPPKGCRDFGSREMLQRNYLIKTIEEVYQLYGFQPLATPTMENLEVLMGKYGDEGDQLLFKVLNSGDFAKKIKFEDNNKLSAKHILPQISSKGLRYDLTVPLARYVSGNRHNIPIPFKRYQIQPVWRADKPQKGRYREFYQCDADVVGSSSLIHEAESLLICRDVFSKLKRDDYEIQLNHRGILQGLCDLFGVQDKMQSFCIGLDKIEKIGIKGVSAEWERKKWDADKVKEIVTFIQSEATTLMDLKNLFQKHNTTQGLDAIATISSILEYAKNLGMSEVEMGKVVFNPFLARGLNYYTGTIYEVTLKEHNIGSVAAGGRYDNLTEQFGGESLTGIGISFGLDRLYDALMANDTLADIPKSNTRVLIFGFEGTPNKYCLDLLATLRQQNINSEIYTLKPKLQKALTYANKKGIGFVVMLGSNEIAQHAYSIKDMETGKQSTISLPELLEMLH